MSGTQPLIRWQYLYIARVTRFAEGLGEQF
jgi:hypothetical protein